MRILYSTRARVGAPNGPGVNEAGFVSELARLNEGTQHETAWVLTPGPRSPGWVPKSLARFVLGVSFFIGEPLHLLKLVIQFWRFKPDIHVARVGPFPFATLMAARWGPPFAAKTFSVAPRSAFGSIPVVSAGLARVNDRVQRSLLDRAIAVDSVTPEIVGLTRSLNPSVPVHLIDNGVDTSLFMPGDIGSSRERLGIPAESPVLIYVGGRPLERGGKEVVEALGSAAVTPQVHGVIVGCDDDEERTLRELAEARGVSNRLHTFPVCSPDQVPGFLAAGTIGVALDDRSRATTYGNASQKLRQYLSCGLGVVAYDGTNDFVREHNLGILVTSTEEVPAAVRELLGSPGLRSGDIRRRARAFAEQSLSHVQRTEQRLRIWGEALELRRGRLPRRDA